jgi:chloramphenicol-sensitive protein RarD
VNGLNKDRSSYRTGIFYGVSAYSLWGLLPFYWKWLGSVAPAEILVHRGIWSLLVCLLFLKFAKKIKVFWGLIRELKTFRILAFASLLLTINWGTFIWAVNADRVVESALGYYITPLVTASFGLFILKEQIRTAQRIALLIAGGGVIVLTIGYGALPWIALVLASTWGSYSLIKKRLKLGALDSLSVETFVALFPSAGYLIFLEIEGSASFGKSWGISLLLLTTGLATVTPLLFFNGATNRLPLVTVGLLQYMTPTIMFFIGVGVNHEDMNQIKLIGFVFIWIALIILGRDLVRSSRSVDNRPN